MLAERARQNLKTTDSKHYKSKSPPSNPPVLQMSLENSWRMQHYIEDAEREGDMELAEWFRKIRDNNLKAGEQGKMMLQQRLQQEMG